MNNLTIFTYSSNSIRVVEIDGQPWFVAMDVCKVLSITEKSRGYAVARLQDDERTLYQIQKGSRSVSVISESGLYRLIMRSDKPEARKFQDWVTREVLPAIRKDGGYILGEEKVKTGEMDEDEFILQAMTILQRKVERLRAEKEAAEAALIEAQPKIDLAERVEKHLRTLTRVARSFEGVNSMKIKSDLLTAGFLYKDHSGTYRVYAKYRQHHFVERLEEQYGKVDIFVGPKGYEVLDALLRDRRLTMLKAFA